MTASWIEVWSFGQGTSRTYCGIARTEEEYAVDVFHGDTCLDAQVYATYESAAAAAADARSQYRSEGAAVRREREFRRELAQSSPTLLAGSCATASDARRRARREYATH